MSLKKALLVAGGLGVFGTTRSQEAKNPFFEHYQTPFEVPPFNQIENQHFKPAFLRGFAEHKAEIQKIVENKEKPNFANTILALEQAGQSLNRVSNVFYNLNSADTDKERQALAAELAPIYAAHQDEIYLNQTLFERVETVWKARQSLGLKPIELRLVEQTYRLFIRKGIKVKDQTRLKEINGRLALLSQNFAQNVLAETNDYKLVLTKAEDLKGLSPSLIKQAASPDQANTWTFSLHQPSFGPFMMQAENRELRAQIWQAFSQRAGRNNEHDNQKIVAELIALRAEKAKILGYEHHAHFILEDRMAQNLDQVYELLDQLLKPAIEASKREAQALQAMAAKWGQTEPIKAYDWSFYQEKVKQEQFQLNSEELKAYFPMGQVRQGIFYVCQQLYGLNFKLREDLPRYHAKVEIYEVIDRNQSSLGLLYMDLEARPSKRSGAWMTAFRPQTYELGERKLPLISIVCNFPQDQGPDQPALLSLREVTTFFHEFGHALHGLLSDVPYASLAGTAVPTDFVELPSQLMEHWAVQPEVLKVYAKHHKTGEAIPDSLIAKIEASGRFGQGFATLSYLLSTYLDLAYHKRGEGLPEGVSIEAFEQQLMEELGIPDYIKPRHQSLFFSHIFAGGYSAGYYSYIWSAVLDCDAFEAFKETSLFDAKQAGAFRKEILERGHSEAPMQLYLNFRGAKPKLEPLLRKRGLLETH